MFRKLFTPAVLAAALFFGTIAVQAAPQAVLTCPANSVQSGSRCVCSAGFYSGGTNGVSGDILIYACEGI